jgi:hypothetical protein
MGKSRVKAPPREQQRKATGRPSIFSPELGTDLCLRIAKGQSLRSICEDDGMPAMSTVCAWLVDPQNEALKAFAQQYGRARDVQADLLVDEILEISDDGRRDYKPGPDGAMVVDHDHIARSRLRVDSRKWFASKVAPKRYGDRIKSEVSGVDGGPVVHEVRWRESE